MLKFYPSLFAGLFLSFILFSCKKEEATPKDGSPCDDGIPCTVDDKYSNGTCMGTPAEVFYFDGNPCTKQTCDPISGNLTTSNLPSGTICPDGTCDGMGACNKVINPMRFLPTLTFDGSGGISLSGDEVSYPCSFHFNMIQDANNDGEFNVEDNLENYVKYSIGANIVGNGYTGIADRGPNDQSLAVYFHYAETALYGVYQYWYYFPVHTFSTFNWGNHEHEWVQFFVYVPNDARNSPFVKMTNNDQLSSFALGGFDMDLRNPMVGIEAGMHNMTPSTKNGVKIRFNGEITRNSGILDVGDGTTQAWKIFCNDTQYPTLGVIPFTMSPADFFEGDPSFPTEIPLYTQDEYGDGVKAPWLRPEWNSPPN